MGRRLPGQHSGVAKAELTESAQLPTGPDPADHPVNPLNDLDRDCTNNG
jgi:hypothetical protein